MIDLQDFHGKNICITFDDGDTLIGKAVYYTSALNDPDGRANLSIESDKAIGCLIAAYADEIADIKVIARESSC